ncbi:MAG: adenylate/guanylate cyclase domain-containing protein [Actinomycetota bacterium]
MSVAADDLIAAGRDALRRHAWVEAFELLTRADAQGGLSGDELRLLGEAAWWSGRSDECIAARERAYGAYLAEGNKPKAARMALQLVRDHDLRMAGAVAGGWFRRAERLLQGAEDTVELGWLEMMRARAALNEGNFDRSVELARGAVDVGARFGDSDLQALALVYQGMGLVGGGDVEEGFGLVDEATVAAVSGELSPNVTGMVYCNMISTCAELADYRRAGEWTEAAKRWCERQAISGFPGLCRVHRAEIIRLRGAWAEAEQEARQACTELREHGWPAFAGDGFYEIGEIRLRMGDLAASDEAFRQANELGRDPQPGLAMLRLAQGRPDAAAAMIARALEETTEPLYRARKLPAAVDIALANGDERGAEAAAAELEGIAERFGIAALEATAAGARARVLLRGGDVGGALERARRGWKLWQELDAPYEAAQARLAIGEAFRAAGDEEAATLELGAARSAFERLGAVPDARRIDELLAGGEERVRRVSKAFMFTDIVRSTNLVEAIGDEAWEDVVRWHDQALRASFGEHGGQEVDHAGDGFFVAFPDPRSALECAVNIQRKLVEHRRTAGFAPQVRIGVHLAQATERGGDYGGKGVHEAARIGSLAGGGEIVASERAVREAGDGFEASDPREVELKGISEPIRVVTLTWR